VYIAVKKLRKSVNSCQSYHINKRVSFFYGPQCRLSIVTIALSNHLATICRRMSHCSMLKSTEVGHFGAQFGEEGVDQCTPNFNTMLTKMSHQVFCLNAVYIAAKKL